VHPRPFLLIALLAPALAGAAPVEVWVSDEQGGAVVRVDADHGTVNARVAVGPRPRGLRLSRNGSTLFVATTGSPAVKPGTRPEAVPPKDPNGDGIAVVDTRTEKLLRRLPGGSDPETFDVSPDGRMLYVSNEDADTLSAVDVDQARILWTLEVGGEPEGVAVRPDGAVVYVTCEGSDSVVAVDVSRRAIIARMSTPSRPRGVIFSSDGTRAWVTAENSGKVYAVDARHHRVTGSTSLGAGALPMGLVLDPDRRMLAVTTGRGGAVVALDPGSLAVRSRLPGVGPRVWGIGRAADGRLFAAGGPSGELVVIDPAVHRVLSRIRLDGLPWGVAVWSPVNASTAGSVELQSR
jgi:YVTN family beta-propeller protein